MDIYVGSIPFKWKEKQIQEIFEPFGEVTQVTIIKDKITRQNKGFGFVTMPDDAQAQKAIQTLNDQEFLGRKIIVKISTPESPKEKKSQPNPMKSRQNKGFRPKK
ncbi:MAG: hypothetical protein R2774_10835 [Saprospiraceae bacterium]